MHAANEMVAANAAAIFGWKRSMCSRPNDKQTELVADFLISLRAVPARQRGHQRRSLCRAARAAEGSATRGSVAT